MSTKTKFLPFFGVLLCLMLSLPFCAFGQDADWKPFKASLVNEEYGVFLQIDFYDNSVVVPGQELFGDVPGYLGANHDSRKWLITDAKITGKNTAQLSVVNDYGSEDLVATLHHNADGSYTLKQGKGSRIKIVENRKWVKLPNELVFTLKK